MTDLMTSLMVIFILLLVASLNNQRVEAGAKARVAREDVMSRLKTAFKDLVGADAVQIEADPKDPLGVLVIPKRQLQGFKLGKATLPSGAVAFLRRFTPRLVGAVCAKGARSEIESVAVEGRADPSGGEQVNLPLSQGRAEAVTDVMLKMESVRDQEGCVTALLSANGRGAAYAQAGASTSASRAREREVVFKIRLHPSVADTFARELGR